LTSKLIDKSFFKLDIRERLTIIQFLCDEAMNSNAIRGAIIGDLETRKEINKEKRYVYNIFFCSDLTWEYCQQKIERDQKAAGRNDGKIERKRETCRWYD